VQTGRYLEPGEDGTAARAGLEAFADLLMPGWRQRAAHVRFMPNLIVTHAVPGERARVDHIPGNVFLAGDWVSGGHAMLADAAAASGIEAAEKAIMASEGLITRAA
jgi:predicted NAD/FAD-dependent oxidoreductase